MKTSIQKNSDRDRTYRENLDGDYIDKQQYLGIAIGLCVTHCLLEVMYLWLGCIPMIVINIFSILAYVVSIVYILKDNMLLSVWIMILEVFMHVVTATVFLGVKSGVLLWLFGTLASIFIPFFSPTLTGKQKRQIILFSVVLIGAFLVITILDYNRILPTKYNVSDEVGKVMYCINAVISFCAILMNTAIYNFRMANKNLELQNSADHDYLTGIYNRKRIQLILDSEVEREKGNAESKLAVDIADVDYFKNINDTYGHKAGDDALKALVKILADNSDSGLLYGRWGGEEFLLIAPEDMEYAKFIALLEKIRKQVEQYEIISGKTKIHMTVSAGAAAFDGSMSVEKLIHNADERLYKAKEAGRNKVVY